MQLCELPAFLESPLLYTIHLPCQPLTLATSADVFTYSHPLAFRVKPFHTIGRIFFLAFYVPTGLPRSCSNPRGPPNHFLSFPPLLPGQCQCFLCLQHLDFLSLTMYMLFPCQVTSSPYILAKASHAWPSPRGSLQFLVVSTGKSVTCLALPRH